MIDIIKNAEFYFSEKYNLTKFDICNDIVRYTTSIQMLMNKEIKPVDIIGKGHKPQYAKRIALDWLNDQLELSKYLLIHFDTKNILTETQKQDENRRV